MLLQCHRVPAGDLLQIEYLRAGLLASLLFLLHDYVAGTNGTTVHSRERTETMLRGVGEVCAKNPDSKALQVMLETGKKM